MAFRAAIAAGLLFLAAFLAAAGFLLGRVTAPDPTPTTPPAPTDSTPAPPPPPQPQPAATTQPATEHALPERIPTPTLRGDGVLSGTVIDQAGAPVPGAHIILSAPTPPTLGDYTLMATSTNDRGEFAFERLPTHRADLLYHLDCEWTSDDRIARAQRTVTLGPGDHKRARIVLVRRGDARIEGAVTSASGPVADVTVALHSPAFEARIRSGPQGRFALRDLPPGSYLVRVFDADPANETFAELHHETRDIRGYVPYNIFLQAGSLHLTLRASPDGPPRPGATVWLAQLESETDGASVERILARGRTDTDGVLRLRLAPVGTHRVRTDLGPLVPDSITVGTGANSRQLHLAERRP